MDGWEEDSALEKKHEGEGRPIWAKRLQADLETSKMELQQVRRAVEVKTP